MQVHHLRSVDGEIVYDMDPEVVTSAAGGTRMAEDVTVDEVALLARSATYRMAVFEQRLGGAGAGIRPRLLDSRAETIARYCEEIAPLVATGRFVTGVDLGTTTADLAAVVDDAPSVFDEVVDGIGFEELAIGRGVVAAADAWLGTIEGRTVALEGFGDVGLCVAREVVRRGGRLVAVSTRRGAVATSAGLDVEELVQARAEHGESFVHHLGLDVHLPRELHELRVDVLVPGGGVGVYDAELAAEVRAQVIVPAAQVPYTRDGLAALRARRIPALPDFVCNGGGVVAHQAPPALTAAEVLGRVDREIGERIDAARLAKMDPVRHAATLAETFLTTWVPVDQRPDGPAVAP